MSVVKDPCDSLADHPRHFEHCEEQHGCRDEQYNRSNDPVHLPSPTYEWLVLHFVGEACLHGLQVRQLFVDQRDHALDLWLA